MKFIEILKDSIFLGGIAYACSWGLFKNIDKKYKSNIINHLDSFSKKSKNPIPFSIPNTANDLLDNIYGKKHLSLRCIFLSIFSLL